MDGIVCIVAYRPKSGHDAELLELIRGRVPTLRKEGLATDRVPVQPIPPPSAEGMPATQPLR